MDRPTKPSGRHAVRLRWDEIITRLSYRFNFLAIRRLKTEFETKEGAWTGAEELKKRFPMLRVKVYDAETKTKEEIQLPRS